MFSRIVPLTAMACVLGVAVMSYFLWRDAESDPHPSPLPRNTLNAATLNEQVERASQYARQAEAAALRAEAALETLLLVEARIAAGQPPVSAQATTVVQDTAAAPEVAVGEAVSP